MGYHNFNAVATEGAKSLTMKMKPYEIENCLLEAFLNESLCVTTEKRTLIMES